MGRRTLRPALFDYSALFIVLHVGAARMGWAKTKPIAGRNAIPYAPSIAGAVIGVICSGVSEFVSRTLTVKLRCGAPIIGRSPIGPAPREYGRRGVIPNRADKNACEACQPPRVILAE